MGLERECPALRAEPIGRPRGWLLYDGCCPLCLRAIARFGNALLERGYGLLPLQDPRALAMLGMEQAQALETVRLVAATGRRHDGADAVGEIARRFWYGWPLWLLTRLPGTRELLRRAYRLVARRRRRPARACLC